MSIQNVKLKICSPRHLLTLKEFTSTEIIELLNVATHLKKFPSKYSDALRGKTLALIFDKSSTRTRLSFEVGMFQLGGQSLFLNRNDLQLGRGETIEDSARVFSRMIHGIVIRTFSQKMVEEFAQYASIPVINGLTDMYHPCQLLADLLTLRERFHKLKGLQVVYVGDGNNMVHSWLIAASMMSINFKVICPKKYKPNTEIFQEAQVIASKNKSLIQMTHGIKGALVGADVVYTDVWTSMGQEQERSKRLKEFKSFQINQKLLKETPNAVFMHCLPAHRGEEVTAEVMASDRSLVWEQAENRLHVQKALLINLLNNDKLKR